MRHLRAVLEAEIARMACEKLTPADIDQLWENVALWRMYIERAQEEKIFELDKGFHRLLYVQCGSPPAVRTIPARSVFHPAPDGY